MMGNFGYLHKTYTYATVILTYCMPQYDVHFLSLKPDHVFICREGACGYLKPYKLQFCIVFCTQATCN